MAGARLADSIASVLEQFTGLTPDPEWAFAHLTQAQTSYATHGYHRYPAKFIPQLAARLIEDYSHPGDTVLYQSPSQSLLITRQTLQRLPYPIPTH